MPLRILQTEVEWQCQMAGVALVDLAIALEASDEGRAWKELQSFLIAAANVSKLLFPSREGMRGRGEELRRSLGVPDDSPLKDRRLRNHFEHLDERLEDWALNSERRNFVGRIIGRQGTVVVTPDPTDHMGQLDPTDFTVDFRGEPFDLQPLVSTLEDLWQRARVEAKRPHYLRRGEEEPAPYVPTGDERRPFTEALERIKQHSSGGGIHVIPREPPPNPPLRHDSPLRLRIECLKVLLPLKRLLRERGADDPFSAWLRSGGGDVRSRDEALEASREYGDETVNLFYDHFFAEVTALCIRLKENGYWDEILDLLYRGPRLPHISAVEKLAEKLTALCDQTQGSITTDDINPPSDITG
jgi:hypothetical protein